MHEPMTLLELEQQLRYAREHGAYDSTPVVLYSYRLGTTDIASISTTMTQGVYARRVVVIKQNSR